MTMGTITYLALFISFLTKCHGVPPNPIDRLWEELSSTKIVMSSIATQLEKFNSLYLMKLEQRMNAISSTIASIDSNIKNLQERAHVWDTFQLHVSAWNEQINTLDKKVEIISKGQEKMLALDGKMNTISNIEYKTERIIGKLDDNLVFLQTMFKQIENQNHDPLLGEFTTRGVLSTLKIIERKLDKLQVQHANSQLMLAKQIDKKKPDNDEQKGKLLIKCNTPPIVEELLSDVASKVDVMFDKFTSTEEQKDENTTEEQQDTSVETSQETKTVTDSDLKLMKGLLKRLNQPCKRTIKVLENLETSIKIIDNTTMAILEDEQTLHNDLLDYCQKNDKKVQTIASKTGDLIARVEEYFAILKNTHAQQETLSSYFAEQREHFSGILQSELSKTTKICSNDVNTNVNIPPVTRTSAEVDIEEENSTGSLGYFYDAPKYSIKQGCEELESNDPSGVYIFGKTEYVNKAGRSYNIRYCNNAQDGGWTVIQRRGVNPEIQKFNLSWADYKHGFGSLDKDFWFGNDFIHSLSDEKSVILRVELEDFEGHTAWAEYTTFIVDNEEDKYKLTISEYRGNASDSFSTHTNSSFSTFDRTNDDAPDCCPCSPSYGGGWWFYSCFEANLNGVYRYANQTDPYNTGYFQGIIWEHWLGNYSLRKSKMMIRPKITIETDIGSGSEPDIIDPFEIPEDP